MNRLATYINEQKQSAPILLMTHVIYGYPSIEKSIEMMRVLLEKKVSILEVQFPFSDPVADGPVITNACHIAIQNMPQLSLCIKQVSLLAEEFPSSKIVLMSYLNPILQYGINKLAKDLSPSVSGVIVPDLPMDQHEMLSPLKEAQISPIWLLIPGMAEQRIELLCQQAEGLIYCVSRKGVTGNTSNMAKNEVLNRTLQRMRTLTDVPVALGFGISNAEQIKAITGKVDIAVVGSALLSSYQKEGISGFSAKVDELLALK